MTSLRRHNVGRKDEVLTDADLLTDCPTAKIRLSPLSLAAVDSQAAIIKPRLRRSD
jgi:hypothetical protein